MDTSLYVRFTKPLWYPWLGANSFPYTKMGTASGALTLVPVYQRPGACGAHFTFDKHRLNIAKNRIKLYWLELIIITNRPR